MCMYHVLFTHSSVDGHLDCFHLLAIVKSTAVNMSVHVFGSLLSVLWGICPEVALLDHMVILCSTFLRNHHTGFHGSHTFLYPPHPPSNAQEFQLLHVLANTYFPFLKIIAILMGVKLTLYLILLFLRFFFDVDHFFSYLFIYLFIYLFMVVLGLRFCARAFSSCGKRRPLFIAVRGPLTIVASLVAEHRLQMRRLSNCGSRA